MAKNDEKYAYLNRLNTEQLEELLRMDMEMAEPGNEDVVFHILEMCIRDRLSLYLPSQSGVMACSFPHGFPLGRISDVPSGPCLLYTSSFPENLLWTGKSATI